MKGFFFVKIYLMCVCFTCMYICAPHACNDDNGQKREVEALELEVQVVMSHHLGTGN